MTDNNISRRAVLLFVGGFFALCAYWNLNDPDALQWVGVYGVASVVSFVALAGRLPRLVPLFFLALSLTGSAFLAFQVIAGGEHFFDERGREMLGLLLVGGWTLVLSRWRRRHTSPVSSS